jgi:hypothetical protein
MGNMFGGGGGGGGGGYQAPTYQSSNPYGPNYKPPTGPQGAGPITPPKAGAAPAETDEERRRRQALILGAPHEGVGDGGDGSGGGSGAAGGGDSGGDGTGGGTGGTY